MTRLSPTSIKMVTGFVIIKSMVSTGSQVLGISSIVAFWLMKWVRYILYCMQYFKSYGYRHHCISVAHCFSSMIAGLGKTVQIVSYIEHLYRVEKLHRPYLVVVPLSTVEHWRREFQGWTDMVCCVYHDRQRVWRDVMREYGMLIQLLRTFVFAIVELTILFRMVL